MFDFEQEEFMRKMNRLEYMKKRAKLSLIGTIAFLFVWVSFLVLMIKTSFFGNKSLLYIVIFTFVVDISTMLFAIFRIKQLDKEIKIVREDIMFSSIKDVAKKEKKQETDIFGEFESVEKTEEKSDGGVLEEFKEIKNDIISDK